MQFALFFRQLAGSDSIVKQSGDDLEIFYVFVESDIFRTAAAFFIRDAVEFVGEYDCRHRIFTEQTFLLGVICCGFCFFDCIHFCMWLIAIPNKPVGANR